MRSVIFYLLASITVAFAQAPTTPPKISYAGYNAPNVSLNSTQLTWISSRMFTILDPCGGPAPTPTTCVHFSSFGSSISTNYVDSSFLGPFAEYVTLAWAATNSYNAENVYEHQIQESYGFNGNFGTTGNFWLGMDQFDAMETAYGQYPGGPPQNGVLTLASGTYTDVTPQSYSGSTNTTISSVLEFGYGQPFDRATFVIATGLSGRTLAWQYWNGSAWVTLTLGTDGTSGLTTNGTIIFQPPPDWARKVETGTGITGGSTQNKFWVRISITGGGTSPVVTTIKGDTLFSTDSATRCPPNNCNLRGWDQGASGVTTCCGGSISYNPSPPATASARFRYQARTQFGFSPNGQYMNHADVQNSTHHTWAELMAYIGGLGITSASPYLTGMFLDDGGGVPKITYPVFPSGTEFGGGGGTLAQWVTDQGASAALVGQSLNSTFGSSFYSIINSGVAGIGFGTKINTVIEAFQSLPLIFSTQFPYSSGSPTQAYDMALTVNNPTNSQLQLMTFDNEYSGCTSAIGQCNGNWHSFDRGVRSPIVTLATYYMGANGNTQLVYNTLGFTYIDNDDYYYYSPTATGTANITICPSPPCTSANLTVTGSFSNLVGVTQTNAIGCGSGPIALEIGNKQSASSPGEALCGIITDASHITLLTNPSQEALHQSYPPGTQITYIADGHQALSPIPTPANVYRWGVWFPAMAVGIGVPDAGGFNGGARAISPSPWKTAASVTSQSNCSALACADVWRRDYTNAIVIMRPYCGNGCNDAELDTSGASNPFCITDGQTYPSCTGTWYPLQPDGTTGAGVSSLSLRAADAAILMKAPLTGGGGSVLAGPSIMAGSAVIR